MKRLLALIVIFITGAQLTLAQETITPALEEHLEAIEQLTAKLRDLTPLRPVEHRFPAREDVVTYLEREMNLQFDPQTLLRETQFYIAFDLLPAEVDLQQVYLDFLSSPAGVGGFYDTDTQGMNVLLVGGGELGDKLPLLDQITYSHEYTHALQDQHFDLDTLMPDAAGVAANPDYALAVQALIEGDATAAMTVYLQTAAQQNPMAALSILTQGFTAGAFNIPKGTPPFIVTELSVPYQDGQTFVAAISREGGWEAVNAAYAKLPTSTEQIMHPAKYQSGEQPQAVTLDTTAPGESWERLADRPLGEFYLRSYLDTQLGSSEANRAAAGWGGDRYHLYYNAETDQRAWALRLVWDTPEDATEFGEALTAFGDARFEGVTAADGCWMGTSESLCVGCSGNTETRVAVAPTVEMARRLLR
ncbi:MAG TPA: hypothetical protein VHO69_10535 [Phototrophicaceae bacterium]|nr:hypothetical protein [Phototrophicaceae bacterium]